VSQIRLYISKQVLVKDFQLVPKQIFFF